MLGYPQSEVDVSPVAPCKVSGSPTEEDTNVADAWLALEAGTGANLTRDEVEDALFLEAKHGTLFNTELVTLSKLRRAYLASLHFPSHPTVDDEREVQS